MTTTSITPIAPITSQQSDVSVDELQRNFIRGSLAQTAYHAWAAQARRERRFNIARLFEAMAAARTARAERAFRQMNEVGTTTQNVLRALNSLEPEATVTGPITGTSALTRELVTRALNALHEVRDLRANELGDLYVCRNCGEMREGHIISPCPICGTVAEAHKAFRSIEAMGTLGPNAIMQFLERTESGMRSMFADMSEELLSTRPAPDRPSLKELTGHLADVDAVFRERAWLLLETDQPELPPAHPPRLDAAAAYRHMPIDTVLEAFHATRKQTLSLLRGLTYAAWHRLGHHELYGDVNLLHQSNWVIAHERNHLIDMAQLRHDLLTGDNTDHLCAELTEIVVVDMNEGE